MSKRATPDIIPPAAAKDDNMYIPQHSSNIHIDHQP